MKTPQNVDFLSTAFAPMPLAPDLQNTRHLPIQSCVSATNAMIDDEQKVEKRMYTSFRKRVKAAVGTLVFLTFVVSRSVGRPLARRTDH